MKLVMLDGTNILHRAYYGIRPLTTRDGLHTNAISGFINSLLRIIEEEKPDYICVAMDTHAKTERTKLYAEYKAQRGPMDSELAEQIPLLYEFLDAMNIVHIEAPGYEADDILGTLSRITTEQGIKSVIVSGDRDILQLIDENTLVKYVSTAMGRTMTKEYDGQLFAEEYGFEPALLVDLKALMGDSSDNIPGVAGVGIKTATDLIQRFGTLSSVYSNIDGGGIKPQVAAKLTAGKESAELSYRLAKINRNVPINDDIDKYRAKQPDNNALHSLFTKLEFLSLINKLKLTEGASPQTEASVEYTSVELNGENWQGCIGKLVNDIAIDYDENLTYVSVFDGSSIYHASEKTTESLALYHKILTELLCNNTNIIAHDVKRLMTSAKHRGIEAGGFVFDTALAAYILEPSAAKYTLERIALAYLQANLPEIGTDATPCRAVYVHKLHKLLEAELEKSAMKELYFSLELPLVPVIFDMEQAGMRVDAEQLRMFGESLGQLIEAVSAKVFELADEVFNINSTQHLGRILFEKLSLPPVKKTKAGYSTDADVLKKLRGKHPIIQHIIEYRQYSKLKSTYCDGLIKVIADDGRIHTSLNMMATATGRLSSTEPNLQNIPVRHELGSELRKMFTAEPGYVLIDADYSQIELRVLAHISGDMNLKEAFTAGDDIHQATVRQVFSGSEAPPSELRRRAKAVNFGIVYGISAFSLADDLGITTSEAKQYIDGYLAHYSGVKQYMEYAQKSAYENGYVTTLLGRRRYIPELKSSNFNLRQFGERVALNAPIQGSAADIIKMAMLRVSERLRRECCEARLIMQIHDELIVEAPKDAAELVTRILKVEMESVIKLDVPLVAEAHIGETWYAAKV